MEITGKSCMGYYSNRICKEETIIVSRGFFGIAKRIKVLVENTTSLFKGNFTILIIAGLMLIMMLSRMPFAKRLIRELDIDWKEQQELE